MGGPDVPRVFAQVVADMFIVDYGESVFDAGGAPVLLPPAIAGPEYTDDLMCGLDGLLLSGGSDVDPRIYGSVPGPRSGILDPLRDAFEFSLVKSAIAASIPILGICRGSQVLNVSQGGSLVEHLEVGTGESHNFFGYAPSHRSHAITIEQGTILHDILGPEAVVNSYHHQSVEVPGEGLVVAARTSDGVVEAIEDADRLIVGVQWHPEWLDDPRLFQWIIDAASRDRSRRLEEVSAR